MSDYDEWIKRLADASARWTALAASSEAARADADEAEDVFYRLQAQFDDLFPAGVKARKGSLVEGTEWEPAV